MPQRRSQEIDTSGFVELLEEAEAAYAAESLFAIRMATQATAIQRKREVWSLRLELRAAEAEAHRRCAVDADFCCTAKSPCGTGDCRYASADLVFLSLPPMPGKAERPVPAAVPTYSIEAAVRPLAALRERSAEQRSA